MPNFKKIDAEMQRVLSDEGAFIVSYQAPTQAQLDEFMGRFKIASIEVEGATYGPNNNLAWTALCPGAMARIVGRRVSLPPARMLQLALAGNSDPRLVGEILARYKTPEPSLDKVRAIWLEMGDELGLN